MSSKNLRFFENGGGSETSVHCGLSDMSPPTKDFDAAGHLIHHFVVPLPPLGKVLC